jgi:hypothetical protein
MGTCPITESARVDRDVGPVFEMAVRQTGRIWKAFARAT